MKLLLISFLASYSLIADSWHDGSGNEWIHLSPRANFQTTVKKCRKEGYRLPSAEAFFEAIDSGLMDPILNAEFGWAIEQLDWIWINRNGETPSFAWMASRWEDTAPEEASAHHWALCTRRRAPAR